MKLWKKWYCIILVVCITLQPCFEAASHRGKTRRRHVKKGNNKVSPAAEFPPQTNTDEFRNAPSYVIQGSNPLTPVSGYHDTVDEIMTFLGHVYTFIRGGTNNYFPGVEFLDKFWADIIRIINKILPFVEMAVNPATIYDYMLYMILKREKISKVDGPPAGTESEPFDEQYTSIVFHPFRQLLTTFLNVLGEFVALVTFNSNFSDFWAKITKIYNKLSLYYVKSLQPDVVRPLAPFVSEPLGVGAVLFPESSYGMYKTDPVIFGVNVFLIFIWQLVFLEMYSPSLANLFDCGELVCDVGLDDEDGSGEEDTDGITTESSPEDGNTEDPPDPPAEDLMPPPNADEEESPPDPLAEEENPPDPPAEDVSTPDPPAEDLAPPDLPAEDLAPPDPPAEDLAPPPPPEESSLDPDPPADDLAAPAPAPTPLGEEANNGDTIGRADYYYYDDNYYDDYESYDDHQYDYHYKA